jgi:hypothetical protein
MAETRRAAVARRQRSVSRLRRGTTGNSHEGAAARRAARGGRLDFPLTSPSITFGNDGVRHLRRVSIVVAGAAVTAVLEQRNAARSFALLRRWGSRGVTEVTGLTSSQSPPFFYWRQRCRHDDRVGGLAAGLTGVAGQWTSGVHCVVDHSPFGRPLARGRRSRPHVAHQIHMKRGDRDPRCSRCGVQLRTAQRWTIGRGPKDGPLKAVMTERSILTPQTPRASPRAQFAALSPAPRR